MSRTYGKIAAIAGLSAVLALGVAPHALAQPIGDPNVNPVLYFIDFGLEPDGVYAPGSVLPSGWVVEGSSQVPNIVVVDAAAYGPGLNMGYSQLQDLVATGQSDRFRSTVVMTFTGLTPGVEYYMEVGFVANVAPAGFAQSDMETNFQLWNPQVNGELSRSESTSDPVNYSILPFNFNSNPDGTADMRLHAYGPSVFGSSDGVPGILRYVQLSEAGAVLPPVVLVDPLLPVAIATPAALVTLAAISVALAGGVLLVRKRRGSTSVATSVATPVATP